MASDFRFKTGIEYVRTPEGAYVVSDSVAFARGYLFVEAQKGRPIGVPDSWISFNHRGWLCWHDPRVVAVGSSIRDTAVTLLGSAINLDNAQQSLTDVVRHLVNELAVSRERYFSAVSRLSGRYLLVDSSSSGTFVQSDAVALRPIYVAPRGRIFGSHQNLVRVAARIHEVSAYGRPIWWRENRARTYPGYSTHWEGVSLVPANHELDLHSFEFARIKMIPEDPHSVDEAHSRLEADFSAQIDVLSNRRNPVLSLTAGADSRVSLAAALPRKDAFQFFTYGLTYSRRKQAVETDLRDSERVAKAAQLKSYRQLVIESSLEDGELKDLLKRSSPRNSNLNVAARYLDEFVGSDVHIRSNTFEIATASYQNLYGYRTATPDVLASIHVFQNDYSQDTLDALAQYFDHSRISQIEGYDPLDLYYWEMRMGSWLAQVVYESDPTFDSHILVNSRSILAYLLSVPLEERMSSSVYRQFVANRSSELASIPINGGR